MVTEQTSLGNINLATVPTAVPISVTDASAFKALPPMVKAVRFMGPITTTIFRPFDPVSLKDVNDLLDRVANGLADAAVPVNITQDVTSLFTDPLRLSHDVV